GDGAGGRSARVRVPPALGPQRAARHRGRPARPGAVLAPCQPAAGCAGPGARTRGSGRALRADELTAVLVGQLAAVVREEAARAGELVGLARQHPDRELLVAEVSPGQLEALG